MLWIKDFLAKNQKIITSKLEQIEKEILQDLPQERMSSNIENIEREIFQLPARERSILAKKLILSIDKEDKKEKVDKEVKENKEGV
jgi:predicted metal-dependent hydrolase